MRNPVSVSASLSRVAAGAAAASILLGAASAGAWPLGGPGDYTMSWFTIDAGGGDSWIGNYSMMGTIGQHDSQNGAFIGDYTMSGGFWVPGVMTDQCPADVDDGSGTGTRDGGVGIEDLLYYLALYDAGDWRADVDDGTDTGTHDGGVGIEDLLYYLARYDAGC